MSVICRGCPFVEVIGIDIVDGVGDDAIAVIVASRRCNDLLEVTQ
jgi:hypothetical protein